MTMGHFGIVSERPFWSRRLELTQLEQFIHDAEAEILLIYYEMHKKTWVMAHIELKNS